MVRKYVHHILMVSRYTERYEAKAKQKRSFIQSHGFTKAREGWPTFFQQVTFSSDLGL